MAFNPYFGLPVYTTADEEPQFPFREGEFVSARLVFAYVSQVHSFGRTHAYLPNVDVELEATLFPWGESHEDYVRGDVWHLNEQHSHKLWFPYDDENILLAVITAQDQVKDFPIELDQLIAVQLVVQYAEVTHPSYADASGQAFLVPAGEQSGSLITAEVDLVEE